MLDSTAAAGARPPRAEPLAMVLQLLRKPHLRLHIGSGRERLEGWVNIDAQALPGVDVVADVTKGLQFSNVAAIFAEHFLEHLPLDLAVAFLNEAWRVLARGGWIRLSTPNLDWVWASHYRLDADLETKRAAALQLNRAFHGWRHQFLWNREMLGEALAACGFVEVRWCEYGQSELPFFRGIERHETYGDSAELPHVIIVEARKGEPQPQRLAELLALIGREFLMHLSD
jgi:predicted SAM-dependent methyltransferase